MGLLKRFSGLRAPGIDFVDGGNSGTGRDLKVGDWIVGRFSGLGEIAAQVDDEMTNDIIHDATPADWSHPKIILGHHL